MKGKSNIIKKAVMVTCVSIFAIGAVAQMSGVEAKADTSRYNLVWSDEFNGTSLNTNNWTCESGNNGSDGNNPGWGNNELEYYADRPENISVSNGTLKITAIEEKYEGCNYTSARIKTSGKQSFQYGKMEARMKLPALDGVWPAFWMMGYDNRGWPYCGEIDILEAWNTGHFAQGAFHWFDETGTGFMYGNRYLYRQMNNNMSDFKGFDKTQWHTYGIEWDKKEIRWTVDDKVYYTLDITDDGRTEAHGLYYFILNMAVGGNLPGIAPKTGTLPITMEVDYVRAYQLEGSPASYYSGKWTEQTSVKTHTVQLTNGKKAVISRTVYDGENVVVPELKKKGYIFKGFYTKSGTKITSETRLYGSVAADAKWIKVKVKKAKISKITAQTKKVKLKFKTSGGSKGYQIQYSTKKGAKGGKKKIVEGKSVTIPKLKSGEKYYFKARAYKLDSKNKKVYGKWSKVKSVVVK